MSRRVALLGTIAAFLLTFPSGAARAQRSDVVHGRVVGADSTPIINANVNVVDTIRSRQNRLAPTSRASSPSPSRAAAGHIW